MIDAPRGLPSSSVRDRHGVNAVRANLPADVVRILPWEKVVNGPTGAPPDGMPGFINVLVQLGQLFYKGLVALVTFLVNLAEAIWDWGMKVLGTIQQAVAGAVQKVADAFATLVDWVIDFIIGSIRGFIDQVAQGLASLSGDFPKETEVYAASLAQGPPGTASQERAANALAFTLFSSALFMLLMGIVSALSIAYAATTPFHGAATQITAGLGSMIVSLLIAQLAIAVVDAWINPTDALEELLPPEAQVIPNIAFSLVDFGLIMGVYIRQATKPLQTLAKFLPVSTAFFMASFALLALSEVLFGHGETTEALIAHLIIDEIAVLVTVTALFNENLKLDWRIKKFYGVFWVINELSGIIALATGVASVLLDAQDLNERL